MIIDKVCKYVTMHRLLHVFFNCFFAALKLFKDAVNFYWVADEFAHWNGIVAVLLFYA